MYTLESKKRQKGWTFRIKNRIQKCSYYTKNRIQARFFLFFFYFLIGIKWSLPFFFTTKCWKLMNLQNIVSLYFSSLSHNSNISLYSSSFITYVLNQDIQYQRLKITSLFFLFFTWKGLHFSFVILTVTRWHISSFLIS